MLIASIDQSNSYTGMALVSATLPIEDALVDWANVRMSQDDAISSFRRCIVPVLLRWTQTYQNIFLLVEQPPPTARGDVEHGHQAAIGDAQGLLGGLALGWWMAQGHPVIGRVEPGGKNSGWRQTVVLEAARSGRLLQTPSRAYTPVVGRLKGKRGKPRRDPDAPGGKGWIMPYLGCGHDLSFSCFSALVEAPAECPECAKPKSGREVADRVRDEWKRLAYDVVDHFWPDHLREIVTDASSRAKTIRKPHRYAGVSDVCDAICIGLHGRIEQQILMVDDIRGA